MKKVSIGCIVNDINYSGSKTPDIAIANIKNFVLFNHVVAKDHLLFCIEHKHKRQDTLYHMIFDTN